MSEKTKTEANPEELTKKQLEGVSGGAFDTYMQFTDSSAQFANSNPELTEQELSHVAGGTAPTTLGPYGPASVQPAKATVIGTGTDSTNPGYTSDQFTLTSSGQGD
jgi:hypothetical protein